MPIAAEATQLTIDPEFHALIPPLGTDELSQLEYNLIADGCRDPLVVWDTEGGDVLLDGHNRYEICTRHGIEFQTVAHTFQSRDEAYNWIIDNQLGRRNLTPDQASYLRGKRYNREKKQGARTDLTSHQNDGKSTAERLADEYGVSRPTIERDGQYAEAVDAIAVNAGDESRAAILSGDVPLSKKEIVELAKAPPEQQRAKMDVHYSSDSPEWYTPAHVVELVVKLMGKIDLDPCSNSKTDPNVPAARHYTSEDNGLGHQWHGKVYMNPPYGRGISEWVEQLCEEHEAGRVTEAIALVPSRTDTEWFRLLHDYPRCFVNGRLSFSGHANAAPFPSMVVYLGKNEAKFVSVFGELGDIYKRI